MLSTIAAVSKALTDALDAGHAVVVRVRRATIVIVVRIAFGK